MKNRTTIGFLALLVLVGVASYLTHTNRALLGLPFGLGPGLDAPVSAILVAVFLIGFLPTAALFTLETTRRRRAARREEERASARAERERRLRHAVDHASDGRWTAVDEELAGVLADDPDDFRALLLRGEALRRRGLTGDALELHRRASVRYPESPAVLRQLVEDYRAHGEPEKAREVEDRLARGHSSLPAPPDDEVVEDPPPGDVDHADVAEGADDTTDDEPTDEPARDDDDEPVAESPSRA
jgi:hypothetical protein